MNASRRSGAARLRALRCAVPTAMAAMLLAACAQAPPATSPSPAPLTAEALAQAMARQPIVLLGEVHDNAAQHALRAQALHLLLAGGARPALAFEQIDQDRQALLDRTRARVHGDVATRVSRIIEAVGGRGWDWDLYRPYLTLALQWDLPIVAANLSRRQAMQVAQDGAQAVFDPAQRAALGLDAIAPDIEAAQEKEIERGHCGGLPKDALAPMATAQVARDAMLAQAIAAYADRGVVLLTGNGHARRDIGVPRHLSARDRARSISIGLLEAGDSSRDHPLAGPGDGGAAAEHGRGSTGGGEAQWFDIAFISPAQQRADPCKDFHHAPKMPAP